MLCLATIIMTTTTHDNSAGLRVSAISLGCAPLGNVYGDLKLDQSKVHKSCVRLNPDGISHELKPLTPPNPRQAIVHGAIDRGVNFFDTSPYYGDTKSESVLGQCLADIPRDKFILATKCGRYNGYTDFSYDRVTKSIDESLERLGVDCIDLMQCHDIEFSSSLQQVVYEGLPALEDAKKAGKIKHFGITGLPLQVVDYVLEHSDADIESILTYCCYTIQNVNLEQFLPRWKHRNLGIIQGGATSMGLLTPQGPQDWHPAPDQVKQVCADAVKQCEEMGESIVKLSFQFSSSNPDVHTCLVGSTSLDMLETNIRWMNQPLDDDTLAVVEESLASVKNKMWVESGSEENIALASGGFWAAGRSGNNVIVGQSANLGRKGN